MLAPMEGLIDDLMRDVLTTAARYDLCVTEFARVSESILPARFFMRIAPELKNGARTASGTPVVVQLLGSDPYRLGETARRLATLSPAAIDLNFGCPAPIVNRNRGGAVLLDEPELLHAIMQAVRAAVPKQISVTAKMRLGVADRSRAVESAQALAEGGAEQIVVHARTKLDGYRPPAHWSWVARIAEVVKLPVVANGEVWTVADYHRCVSESGCRDVMLGRGAVADPFLATRIQAELAGGEANSHAQDWPQLLGFMNAFWAGVQRKVLPRHAPGRLKQWLNLMRRSYPQAELLYQSIRPLQDCASISLRLQQACALA